MKTAQNRWFSRLGARPGRLAVAAITLAALSLFGNSLLMWLGFSDTDRLVETALPLILALFVLAAAVPFVPGAEIGLALLLVFGAEVALEVYLAMLAALLLAYGAGRAMPDRWILRIWAWLAPRRLDGKLPAPNTGSGSGRLLGTLANNRHLALALALNTPGNAVLGGGGGLALAAGASRLISPRAFLLTVAIAVAPVPLCIAILDRLGLAWSLL